MTIHGALVDVGDAPGLAATIIAEVQAGAKAGKGPFAATYALEGFSWAGQVDRMIAVYEEAIARSG